MQYSKEDKKFMALAIEQARLSFEEGDFPVGAVLIINGELVGKERNSIRSDNNWTSHAEKKLISKYASLIRDNLHHKDSVVTLYTSLEPCLMCFGVSVLNRISRIVYACPDPFTGGTGIQLDTLPEGYKTMWPIIVGGLMKEESYDLLLEFMDKQDMNKWGESIDAFKKMK